MEVFLVQAGPPNLPSFNLVINHKHCIASYQFDYQDVKDINFLFLNPNTCKILLEYSVFSLNHTLVNRKRRLYWNYLWKHPAHISTPERAISDAADALTWFYVRFL